MAAPKRYRDSKGQFVSKSVYESLKRLGSRAASSGRKAIKSASGFVDSILQKIDASASVDVFTKINNAFFLAKEQLLIDIYKDDISKDFLAKGPIFGYFGFEASDNPIENLIDFLDSSISLRMTPLKNGKARAIVSIPSKEDFRQDPTFDLPWESGKSWVEAIETGGFNNIDQYMFKIGKGRSTKGIQTKGGSLKSQVSFSKSEYLSRALLRFRRKMAKYV